MVVSITAIGAATSSNSLVLNGISPFGRHLAIGAAATTGNQLPAKKIPVDARNLPVPSSTDVKISETGLRASAAYQASAAIKATGTETSTSAETIQLTKKMSARADGVKDPMSIDAPVSGPASSVDSGTSTETLQSERILASILLALLMQYQHESANNIAARQFAAI
jgi:hypothetical protein